MEKELKEYKEAIEENLEASKKEMGAKDAKRKAYYRLIRAKEALRAKEIDLLEESERNMNKNA